jgi:hypothetical protein
MRSPGLGGRVVRRDLDVSKERNAFRITSEKKTKHDTSRSRLEGKLNVFPVDGSNIFCRTLGCH